MTVGNAITRVSAVGVGGLTGFALGVSLPGILQVVDLFKAVGDRKKREDARRLCTCVAEEIEALRASEYAREPAAGIFEAALGICTDTLDRHGLSSDAFLKLGLDPDRAADDALSHARFNRLDESDIPGAARRILVCFYERVRREKDLLEEIVPDVYREIMRQGGVVDGVDERTQRIERTTEEVTPRGTAAARSRQRRPLRRSKPLFRLSPVTPKRHPKNRTSSAPCNSWPKARPRRPRRTSGKWRSGKRRAGGRSWRPAPVTSPRQPRPRRASRRLCLPAQRRGRALAAYRRAAALDPDHIGTWIFISRLEVAAGAARRGGRGGTAGAGGGAGAGEYARGECSSRNVGRCSAVAQGDLGGAFRPSKRAMPIAGDLAARDPGNTDWAARLSVSLSKVGDVRVAQGDLPAALLAFEEGLTIRRDLASRDPGNAGWARDVSVSLVKVGDVRVAQGDLPAALVAYEEGLEIARDLASRDPGNAGWARDVSVSLNKVGDVRVAQGELPAALVAFEEGLDDCPRSGVARSGQCRVGARRLGEPGADRRRAGGAGRSAGGARGLRGRA